MNDTSVRTSGNRLDGLIALNTLGNGDNGGFGQALGNTEIPPQPRLSASAQNPLPENSNNLLLADASGVSNINFTKPASTTSAKTFVPYSELPASKLPNPNRIDFDARIKNTSPALLKVIDEEAARYGINPNGGKLIMLLESSGNPKAYNESTGATGPYQHLSSSSAEQGIDPWDPRQNTAGAFRQWQGLDRNGRDEPGDSPIEKMGKYLKVPKEEVPTWALYLAHQQGKTGGPALIQAYADPAQKNRKAGDVINEAVQKANPGSKTNGFKNIAGNIPAEYLERQKPNYPGLSGDALKMAVAKDITVEEFVNAKRDRFGPVGDEPILAAKK